MYQLKTSHLLAFSGKYGVSISATSSSEPRDDIGHHRKRELPYLLDGTTIKTVADESIEITTNRSSRWMNEKVNWFGLEKTDTIFNIFPYRILYTPILWASLGLCKVCRPKPQAQSGSGRELPCDERVAVKLPLLFGCCSVVPNKSTA